jgi:hypothetical protein
MGTAKMIQSIGAEDRDTALRQPAFEFMHPRENHLFRTSAQLQDR